MADHLTSRRRVLSLGFLTCGSGVLRAAPEFGSGVDSAWQKELMARLRSIASWVRPVAAADALELHCGVAELGSWAGRPARIAGKGTRVHARGNILTFTVDGHAVRVVLHSVA